MRDFEEVIAWATALSPFRMVGIDGLPLAGKSTLADRLAAAVGAQCLRLDDFIKVEEEWCSRDRPSFPFDYIRYDEFMTAVRELAATGTCSYRVYDWKTGKIANESRSVHRPAIVEGVSALHPDLVSLYDLRIWVESDMASTFAAACQRGVGPWACEWRQVFLPSVELYLRTMPRDRADIIARGRGK